MTGVDVGVENGVGVRVGVCIGVGVLSDRGVFTQPDKTATANIMKKIFGIVVTMNPQTLLLFKKIFRFFGEGHFFAFLRTFFFSFIGSTSLDLSIKSSKSSSGSASFECNSTSFSFTHLSPASAHF